MGELERADAIVGEREQHALAMDRPGERALVARCRGLIAAARGSLVPAADCLAEALRVYEQVPVPLERGRTLLAMGQVQRRAKQNRAARASLESALAVFESLGVPLWAERARAELRRIGGRTASRDELTMAELRIAELVARGKTNKEVAAELFVTVHTVEAALTRIYAKLGIRSRTELARRGAHPGKV